MISKYGALSELKPGQSARVRKLACTGKLRRRFLDLGLGEDTKVACVGRSPSGDPGAFLIRGAVIAIRNRDSRDILVERERPSAPGKTPAPKSAALAGNPNVGKSTVFNGPSPTHRQLARKNGGTGIRFLSDSPSYLSAYRYPRRLLTGCPFPGRRNHPGFSLFRRSRSRHRRL